MAASNPAADAAIQDMRRAATGADVPMFAKGSAGAREAFTHMRRGGVLGMLPDTRDRTADVYTLSLAMNATLERSIRGQPECWL